MHVDQLKISKEEATKLWQRYQTHKHYEKRNPLDAEIEHIANLIAKGKMIIRGKASIVGAGLNEDKMPKLAIARADSTFCRLHPSANGSATMLSGLEWSQGNTARSRMFRFEPGSFPGIHTSKFDYKAVMPHIPPDIRPKRGLANYHVVWEAKWEPVPPVDPILMRQIGKSDFYLVLGQWDLTDVERAVMQSRMGVQ